MWKWLFSNKENESTESKKDYIWVTQPYHPDLMLVQIETLYPNCIQYIEGLSKINRTIESGGEIINYKVYQDVEIHTLHDWILDTDGCYHPNVPNLIQDWRDQCNRFNMLYQSLRDNSDYRKQCESTLLVHLVKNIASLDNQFIELRLS